MRRGHPPLPTLFFFLALALNTAVPLFGASSAWATVAFGRQTGKDCTYCHETPGGPLTAAGRVFRENGFQLPPAGDGGGTAPGSSDTTSPGVPPAGTSPSAGGSGTPGGASTSAGTAGLGGASTSAGSRGSEGETAGGPLLSLPGWVRVLLLWAHLVGMVAWLGAIVFVHVVQSPRIAGQGIPRGYLKLAWPSLVTVGGSGLLLTLNDVTALGTIPDSRWGRILLGKIAVYLVLVGVATLATFVISPRLRRLADTAAGHPLKAHDHYKADGRVTIAYEGRVYDVSTSKLWREGRHARRHEAWRDLTAEMANAPHGPEVLEHFPVLLGGSASTPRPVRAFLVLAYSNLALVLLVLLLVAAW